MKIVVGSTNPVKIEAVRQAFRAYFPESEIIVIGIDAPSNVASLPSTQLETYTGALNRAKFCKENYEADYFVGLEGGTAPFFDTIEIGLIEWVVVLKKSSDIIGKAGGGILIFPKVLCELFVKWKSKGRALGSAVNELFNTSNCEEKEGANGLLTKGLIHRTVYYRDTTIQALVPHIKAWEG